VKPLSAYSSNRDNNFNIIRFFAAILVIVSHSYVLSLGKGNEDPFHNLFGVSLGTVAVDVFFITSGFLVTASLVNRGNLTSFFLNRFLRIMPGLFVALIFTTLVIGLVFSTSSVKEYLTDDQTLIYFFKNLSLIFGVNHELPGVFSEIPFPNAVNGSLWTLPWEVRMYAVLFILGIFVYLMPIWHINHLQIITFILGFGAIFLFLFNWNFKISDNYFLVKGTHLGGLFFIGAFFYLSRKSIYIDGKLGWFLLSLLFVSVLWNQKLFFVFYYVTIAYLVMLIAYLPNGKIRSFNQYGDYSYGLYIYAFPVQQSIIFLIPGLTPVYVIVISLTITLILAYFSWHYVEKPMLKHKGKSVIIDAWFASVAKRCR